MESAWKVLQSTKTPVDQQVDKPQMNQSTGENSNKGTQLFQKKIFIGSLLVISIVVIFFSLYFWQNKKIAMPTPVATISPSTPVTVPLTIQHKSNDVPEATVEVQVGNNQPIAIPIDTGSTGLRIYAQQNFLNPQSGISCTNTPDTASFSNDRSYTITGNICYARITIGGITTSAPIPFAYETGSSCTSNACTPLSSKVKHGDYGILGIALTKAQTIVNPLFYLNGGVGRIFSLSLEPTSGTLTLNAPSPPSQTAAIFPENSTGSDLMGVPTYSKEANTCFSANNKTQMCIPTVFDTGAPAPFIDALWPSLPVSRNGSSTYITSGTTIALHPPGSNFTILSLVAGTKKAFNLISVTEDTSHTGTRANASIQAFFGHTITFDDVHGDMAISLK